LQADGHRVRLATHKNFEDFVLKAGLEFYPLGGDPKVLAECKQFLFFFETGLSISFIIRYLILLIELILML
jgi:hypothetical protein